MQIVYRRELNDRMIGEITIVLAFVLLSCFILTVEILQAGTELEWKNPCVLFLSNLRIKI